MSRRRWPLEHDRGCRRRWSDRGLPSLRNRSPSCGPGWPRADAHRRSSEPISADAERAPEPVVREPIAVTPSAQNRPADRRRSREPIAMTSSRASVPSDIAVARREAVDIVPHSRCVTHAAAVAHVAVVTHVVDRVTHADAARERRGKGADSTCHRDAKAAEAARRSLQSCSCCSPAAERWRRGAFSAAAALTTGTVVGHDEPAGRAGRPRRQAAGRVSDHADGRRGHARPRAARRRRAANDVARRRRGRPARRSTSSWPRVGRSPSGSLQVRTEPAGAKVSVDGVARGVSPVIVADLAPGEHAVVVETESGIDEADGDR